MMKDCLIKMMDGALVSYKDDFDYTLSCSTCNYGSEYITEIDIVLTMYKVHAKINSMYNYILSEGQMMTLFIREYKSIEKMTEAEFTVWFKQQLQEITGDDEYIEAYEIVEL